MLDRCKKWITSRLGSNRPPRRRTASQFRGQLEALESRNVLSATLGTASYDVVAVQVGPTSVTIVAVAEYEPMASIADAAAKFVENRVAADGLLRAFGPLAAHAPHFEPPFETPFGLSFRPTPKPQQFISSNFWLKPEMSAGPGGVLNQTGDYGGGNTSADIEAGPPEGAPAGVLKLPQRASAPSDSTSRPVPNTNGAILSDGSTTTGNLRLSTNWSPPPRPLYNVVNQALQAAFFTSTGSELRESPVRLAVESRDLAIEDFSSNSLLLAATFDVDSDDDAQGSVDDERGALGITDEDGGDSKSGTIADNLAESLDALQRERAAVDAVLTELHDIDLTDADAQAASAAHLTTNAEMRELAERFFLPQSSVPAQSTDDASAGGMVLLAATGDANSSAYELIAPPADKAAGNSIAALASEAPVGLYQAVDIGARPGQMSAAENISIAAPPAKVHTSAATENAPAKKSEQPT